MSNLKPVKLSQDLAYLDHFATTWFVFTKQIHFPIPMSKTLCFGKSKYLSRLILIKKPETPLFPIIKFLSHKRVVFAITEF
jgi:hypothetical protein